MRNCLHRNVALILSMKLSNYGRNFLHRHVVLIFLYCERLWTEFIASSHNAKPHYFLRNIHGFLKLHLLSVKSTTLTRFEISKTLFSNIFFLFFFYLTTIFVTNINHLHKIGKDLKWRTTYLESASLPIKRLYEARERRSRAYSWTSLPCLCQENHNYTLIITSILIHHTHSFKAK